MSFNDKWSTFHNNWCMYQPNVSKIYQINVFDDGNHKFKNYSNQWYMHGEWKSKVSLVNKYPFSQTNEQGILNLYFIFLKNNYEELVGEVENKITYFYWLIDNKDVIISKALTTRNK